MVVGDQQGMEAVAHDYFNDLFSPSQWANHQVLNVTQAVVSDELNHMLTASFEKDEFKEALFHMNHENTSGLDGLNAAFYRRFWNLCGDEIFKAWCSGLVLGTLSERINDTSIVLIPKCDNPKKNGGLQTDCIV